MVNELKLYKLVVLAMFLLSGCANLQELGLSIVGAVLWIEARLISDELLQNI